MLYGVFGWIEVVLVSVGLVVSDGKFKVVEIYIRLKV